MWIYPPTTMWNVKYYSKLWTDGLCREGGFELYVCSKKQYHTPWSGKCVAAHEQFSVEYLKYVTGRNICGQTISCETEFIEADRRIYVAANLAIIGSAGGLPPVRRQAIIWTNTGILLAPLSSPGHQYWLCRINGSLMFRYEVFQPYFTSKCKKWPTIKTFVYANSTYSASQNII